MQYKRLFHIWTRCSVSLRLKTAAKPLWKGPIMFMNRWISLVALTIPVTANAVDLKTIKTSSFDAVTAEVRALVKSESAKNVLIVYDIDNTTLATEKDLGSEHWYLWQRQLIESGIKTAPAVASNIEDLLTAQSWIYHIAGMKPVAPEIPKQIQYQRSQGASTIILTSRSPGLRDATLREVQRNQIYLSSAREFGVHDLSEPFIPYQLDQPERFGLTDRDVEQFKLKPAQATVFDRGVYLTQGQHKGVMLKSLLSRMKRSFTAIVFVDDRASHIEGMRAAFADRPEKMVTIQYSKQAQAIDAFNRSDKRQVIGEWCRLVEGVASSVLAASDRARFIKCR